MIIDVLPDTDQVSNLPDDASPTLIGAHRQKQKEGNLAIEKIERGMIERSQSQFVPQRSPVIRDDLSISRKSDMYNDPMNASAKGGEKDQNKSITRICLTGGPCAGKTTALATLSIHMKQIGYRVLNVPEAATILMKGGALIQTPKMTFSNAVKFQISLMKL